jgi:4-amino-4-deoxy-L-arabinose transferase-like glycosyltransferase
MPDSRWAAALFACAFLSRLMAYLGCAIFGTDGCHYLLMADWMREGRFHDALQVAYHPLYPLLIAAGRSLGGTSEQVAGHLSILLGSAALVPLFLSVRGVFGRPAAVLTSLLYAFSPYLTELQSEVMTEGTYFFFFFSSMWLTGRLMEAPSPARSIVLGAAAASAFLTRPEGLLPVVLSILWPLAALGRVRKDVARRLAGVALTVATITLLLSPYLLWVKAERGHWALSVRPSAMAAEKGVGLADEPSDRSEEMQLPLLRIYLNGMYRASLYGVLIPFYLIGFASLKEVGLGRAAWYLSFPLGHLGGMLAALRTATFMSERYLLSGMALLAAVAAWGMVIAMRASARRWPESRLRPVLCCTGILLLAIVPATRCLKVRRQECRSYPLAAQAILATGARPRAMTGVEQVAYYCGSRSYYTPRDRKGLVERQRQQPMDYFVYSDKDLRGRPEYVAMLRSLEWLDPAVVVSGPPGSWKVYIHRARQVP